MKLSRKFLSYALVFATGGSAVLTTAAQAAPAAAAKKDDKKKGKTPPSAAPDAATPVAATPAKKEDPKKPEERKGPASFNATAKPGSQTPEEAATAEAADKKRDEEIEQLKTVIKRIPADSGQKADLIFQLAELYYEKSKYLYSKEMRGYFAAQEELAKKQDRGEKVGEAKLDNSGSRLWRDEALRLYTQILKEYPTYERKDEVLFTLAYNQYEDLKTRPTAVQNYWSLIKQYPNSKFLYDSYVQLGEHFFAGNDLDKARKAYLEAFKSTNPKVHSFAQYKLAWCDYNAGDYQGAITRFKDVVDFTEKSAKSGSDGKKDNVLKNEALNDVVQSFVQVEATDEAIQYFESKTSKKKAHRLTKKLASNMADGGKHDSAIKVYRRLLEADPMEEEAPSYQNSIVKSYEQLRKRDLVFKEMRVLVTDFGPKSKWAEVNKKNEPAIRQAYEETEGAMRGMVTEYHREAQTTKDVATYKLASNIYKEYLDSFGESEYSFNLRFYHAEILYTLNHFAEAAEEYSKVVDAAPGEYGNKDYKKTAAYDTILCYEKLAADARGEIKIVELGDTQKVDEKTKKDTIKKVSLKIEQKNLKEEDIPKWEKALADACDRYVKAVTDDKDEISLRYKAAFIYYDHHHDVEAASRFGDIINKWPQDKFSRQAADFTLNILENKEQWSELNRLSRAFYANKKLTTGDVAFTGRLGTLVEGSQYKVDLALYDEAKKAQSQDKKFEAAVAFRDFQKEFPKSQYSAQALYASMVIFQDAGQLDKGIEVGQQLVKEYQDKPQANTALNSLGYYYTKTAQYPKSAEAYESYVKLWEKAHGIVDPNDLKKGAKAPVAVKAAPVAVKKPVAAKPGEKTDDAPPPADPVGELDKNVADALYNAALWHQGMGEDDKAIALFNKYVDYVGKKYPGFADKKDAPDVFLNIAKIHEKAHRQKETALAYEAYITRFGKDVTPGQVFAAKYRQFVAVRDQHPPTVAAGKHVENPEVLKLMDDLSKSYVKLDAKSKDDVANIDAYGHIRFLQLEPMWKEYVAINFKNPARLVADLTDKLKRTDILKNAYTDVLASRSGEWGIAALTRIGLAYEDFARDLIDSPDPKGLTDDQLGMYRSEIENKAFPLEDKAVEALEAALAKSSELKVYSDFTLQAQDQLNKVRPGAFGEVRAVAYRGSEVFVTAQPKLAQVEVPKEAPAPAPAPPTGTPPPPAADPKAGSGSN